MSGLDNFINGLKDTQSAINRTQNVANRVSRVASTGTKIVNTGSNLAGRVTGVQTTSNGTTVAVQTQGGAGAADEVNGGLIAPEGTCIILPPQVTTGGKPRYIGKEAYQTIVDMINGKSTVGNAVVIGDDMKLSSKVYDITSSGVFLKGTNTPVDIQYNSDRKVAGVYLTEREYESCVKGITTTDQNTQKFTTSSELGTAEDEDVRPWYIRWLKEIIIGTTFVLGGGLMFWLVHRQKKKTKQANNQANDLKQQASTLTEQVNDLQKQNQNTLADNATKVNPDTLDPSASFVQVNTGNSLG